MSDICNEPLWSNNQKGACAYEEQLTATIDIPLQERYMISLKEVSTYFHIGIKKMRGMAEDNEGGFALFLGNRYIICRPKFEEYLLKVVANSRTEQEVCDDEISS